MPASSTMFVSAARVLTTALHLPCCLAAWSSKVRQLTLLESRFFHATLSTTYRICSATSKRIPIASSAGAPNLFAGRAVAGGTHTSTRRNLCRSFYCNDNSTTDDDGVPKARKSVTTGSANSNGGTVDPTVLTDQPPPPERSADRPLPSMTPFSIWFKLIDEKKNDIGNVACCATLDGEITMEAVATAIKNKWAKALTDIDAASLVMYASTDRHLTTPLVSKEIWDLQLHGGASFDHPIVAYVPAEIEVTPEVDDEIWANEVHSRGVRFLDSILKPLEPILSKDNAESGMSIMRDVPMLETGEILNVVIRKISVPFWKACIGPDDDDIIYKPLLKLCAVGSPGTGKSTSIAFLVRLLLQERKTVVYHTRQTDWIYEFTPSSKTGYVSCNVYREPPDYGTAGDEIISLSDPKTYYIVDPGRSRDSCDLSSNYDDGPKLIIVSSPNPIHWGGNEFEKKRFGMGTFRFYPMWALDELLLARAFINPRISEEEVIERFQLVGGTPRHVFDNSFDSSAQKDLQDEVIDKVHFAEMNKLFESAHGRYDVLDATSPQSCIYGIQSSQETNFCRMVAEPISESVRVRLSTHFSEVLYDQIVPKG